MKDKSKKSTYSTTFGIDPKNQPIPQPLVLTQLKMRSRQFLKRIFENCGADEVRTHDLFIANEALFQLSYGPDKIKGETLVPMPERFQAKNFILFLHARVFLPAVFSLRAAFQKNGSAHASRARIRRENLILLKRQK